MNNVKDTQSFYTTRNVVRRRAIGTHFLYYELCFRNPVKSKSPVPVASMITEKQTTPCISNFLEEFRPVHWSRTIIKSFCSMINKDSYRDLMSRGWRIEETATQADFKKSIIHVCLSHSMHLMRNKCKQMSTCQINVAMHAISLLVN